MEYFDFERILSAKRMQRYKKMLRMVILARLWLCIATTYDCRRKCLPS